MSGDGGSLDPAWASLGPRAALLLRMGTALHRAGTPAHRLEGVLDRLAEHLRVEAQIFSMPTAVFAAIGPTHAGRTVLLRVQPGGPDLGMQAELDAVAEGLLTNQLLPNGAHARLDKLEARDSPWSRLAGVFAFVGTGAAASVVLGGGPYEAATGAVAGLGVALLEWASARWVGLGNVFEPLATFFAMALSLLVHHLVAPIDVVSTTLGAVIVLLPGLSLTTSITELATRNLVSGTARLAGASVTFVSMAVGAALAVPLSEVLPPAPEVALPGLPDLARWGVLPVVGLMLAVLLRARLRDVGWVVLAPGLAMGLAVAGEAGLGPIAGVGAAAFGLALVSNVIARLRHRPASTLLVPGILLLVPGSTGLRAILRLVEHDVVEGVDGFFRAVLVATSLAAGVLMANVVVNPRQSL